MATKKAPFCSDEELINELQKLGYNDVPPNVFQLMKNDLSDLVEKEEYYSDTTEKDEKQLPFSTSIGCRNAQKKCDVGFGEPTEKLKSQSSEEALRNVEPPGTSPRNKNLVPGEDPYNKYRNRFKHLELSSFHRRQADRNKSDNIDSDSRETSSATSSASITRSYPYVPNSMKQASSKLPEIHKTHSLKEKIYCDPNHPINSFFNTVQSEANDSLVAYRNRLESLKINSVGSRHENLVLDGCCSPDMQSEMTDSSLSISGNRMKRKVLRHRDGRAVISEVFRDIPNIFNTSYPESGTFGSSKSFSSSDLSWKSNSSTGSVSVSSPSFESGSSSIYSLTSPRSLHSRFVGQRKKKNDPVTMYNYYKKYWNSFKPPGEKTHDKLRWAVRDRMLDYNL